MTEKQEKYEKRWEMFRKIWRERPHKSEVSGTFLGSSIKSYFFDHALPRSKYPQFELEEDNIILVTQEEHTRRTNGSPLEGHKQLIDKIRDKLLNT